MVFPKPSLRVLVKFKQYFIKKFYIHAIYSLSMDTGFDSKLKAYMKVISCFRYILYNMW